MPVPEYLLDAALAAIVAVMMQRAKAGLQTYWEHVGTFHPYIRPSWTQRYQVRVPVPNKPGYTYLTWQPITNPARRWLRFRGAVVSQGLRDFVLWNTPFVSDYAGEEDGLYKKGRKEMWEAARRELSRVTKGKKPGLYFVESGGDLVASPFFVNEFFVRVAARLFASYFPHFLGVGTLRGISQWKTVVDPVTGAAVFRWEPLRFWFGNRNGALCDVEEGVSE